MNPAKSTSKHYLALLLAAVALAIAAALIAPASAYAASEQKMYRLYNPNSGEHFYTANVMEMTNLHGLGWNYEGVGWEAPTSGSSVYRLYNPNAGDHHYTMSAVEKDGLVALGWRYEGVGWYGFEPASGTYVTSLDYSQAVDLPVSTSAYSVVVAREDGMVIASKSPHRKCETGSTAKLMTCWLAQESLGDSPVTLSPS